MAEDTRCCGSGTCIIDPEGRCWCGQQWNGERMAAPPLQMPTAPPLAAAPQADTDAETPVR